MFIRDHSKAHGSDSSSYDSMQPSRLLQELDGDHWPMLYNLEYCSTSDLLRTKIAAAPPPSSKYPSHTDRVRDFHSD